MIVVIIGILVIGTPFTLWWWKQADRWADSEHKRFKPDPRKADPRPKVVIKEPETRSEG